MSEAKACCGNCDHWQYIGEGKIEGANDVGFNGRKTDTFRVGACAANPPQVFMVPQGSRVVSGAMQLSVQRHYPQTAESETCGAHPRKRLQFLKVVAGSIIEQYFSRLEYDPDKHHVKGGFSRPPSLDEAKNLAGNLNDGGDNGKNT